MHSCPWFSMALFGCFYFFLSELGVDRLLQHQAFVFLLLLMGPRGSKILDIGTRRPDGVDLPAH